MFPCNTYLLPVDRDIAIRTGPEEGNAMRTGLTVRRFARGDCKRFVCARLWFPSPLNCGFDASMGARDPGGGW